METNITPDDVSAVAKEEGGTTKGSTSAKMQSQMTKERQANDTSNPTTRPAPGSNIKPEDVSAVAAKEGGTTKGSKSAQMQSQMTREMQANASNSTAKSTSNTPSTPQAQSTTTKQSNFESVASDVSAKLSQDPASVTPEDANTLESREHRATGVRPPSDSLSAQAKRVASANERGAPLPGNSSVQDSSNGAPPASTRAQQSALDKEANFEDAVAEVGSKMAAEPESVNEDDAKLLHSREQRARGITEKGGVASQAGRLAAENMGATKG